MKQLFKTHIKHRLLAMHEIFIETGIDRSINNLSMLLLRVGQLSVVNEKLKKDTIKIVLLKEAFFVLVRYIFLVFIAIQRY